MWFSYVPTECIVCFQVDKVMIVHVLSNLVKMYVIWQLQSYFLTSSNGHWRHPNCVLLLGQAWANLSTSVTALQTYIACMVSCLRSEGNKVAFIWCYREFARNIFEPIIVPAKHNFSLKVSLAQENLIAH